MRPLALAARSVIAFTLLASAADAAGAAGATGAPTVAPASANSAAELLARAQEVYQREGPRQALPLFEESERSARAAGDEVTAAIAQGLAGNCHKRLGDSARARLLLERALATKERLGARLEAGKTINHLGLLAWEQGQYPEALRRFAAARDIARTLGDRRLEAALDNNTALVLDELGDLDASERSYHKALAIRRALGDREAEAVTLGNLGGLEFLRGNFAEAVARYERALALSRALGNKAAESKNLGNLGLCLSWLDRIPEALQHLDQALSVARTAGLAKDEADWLKYRGSALVRRGDYSLALASYGEADVIYRRAGAEREQVELLIDVARIHLEMGETLASQEQLGRAVAIADRLGFVRGSILAMIELGDQAGKLCDARQALAHWTRALLLARASSDPVQEATLLERIGRLAIDAQRLDEGAEWIEAGLAIARRRGLIGLEATILRDQAELARRRGRHALALELHGKGAAIADRIGAPELAWPHLHGQGRALEALGRRREAAAAYQAAVDRIEPVRGRIGDLALRAGYLESRAEVYADLARILLELGKLGEGFRAIESLRSRAWLDLLGSGPAGLPRAEGPRRVEEAELRRKLERLTAELTRERALEPASQRSAAIQTWSRELTQARRRYTLLLSELRSRDPRWAALVSETVVEMATVQRELAADEALIEFLVTRDSLHILVLRRERVVHRIVPESAERLTRRVELLRDRIVAEHADWREAAQGLWGTLLEPVEREIHGASRLYLLPQGPLHELPFAALAAPPGAERRHLIERFELVSLPAAGALLRAASVRPTGPREHALALAPERARLRHAAAEAHEVAARFPHGQALVGAEASERELKARAAGQQVLHLATHSQLDRDNPLFSHVVLEPGAEEDGRLHLFEVLGLRLSADLVTLGACDSALGSSWFQAGSSGLERVSLSLSFLNAGAGAVLASQWQVDDRATAELMRRFYRHLATAGKSAALARAQRELIASRDPVLERPRAWAAFVLAGDGR